MSVEVKTPEKVKSIIGIDFGETYAAGCVSKQVEDYNVSGKSLSFSKQALIKCLTLKTKALNEPLRLFMNWLKQWKKDYSICVLM